MQTIKCGTILLSLLCTLKNINAMTLRECCFENQQGFCLDPNGEFIPDPEDLAQANQDQCARYREILEDEKKCQRQSTLFTRSHLKEERADCNTEWLDSLPSPIRYKIHGNMQFTWTDAHASTMARKAEQIARRSDVTNIYLDTPLYISLGIDLDLDLNELSEACSIDPDNLYRILKLEPDILVEQENGIYFIIEVISRSETETNQKRKISKICKAFPGKFDQEQSQAIPPNISSKFSPIIPRIIRKEFSLDYRLSAM